LRRFAVLVDILQMSVTSDKLYEEVWAEPMAKVAVRYRISANYLARVCHHLNVPFPHRGYWAKRQLGKAPTRLPLPAPRPAESKDRTWAPEPVGEVPEGLAGETRRIEW